MKTEYRAVRHYGKSTKVMFKSENRDEVISFKKDWTKKNGVKLHLVEITK